MVVIVGPEFLGATSVSGTIAFFLFTAAVIVLLYTFLGYPMLLMLWGKLIPQPIRHRRFDTDVVIVVVVHNGENLIEQKLVTCLAQDFPPEQLRVLIVSDGSNDATCAIVEAFSKKNMAPTRVTLLALPERRGKSACLNDAVNACDETIIVFTDVRQTLHTSAVRCLVDNFSDPQIGAVSGQLVFEREGITEFGAGIDAYWRYEKFLRRLQSQVGSTIGVTGAIYALRRQCFREIPSETILDDVLIPMNVVMQGKRVVFDNNAIAYDKPTRNIAHERIRKVRTLAGNFQLIAKYPEWVSPWSNPIAIHFVSHKIMRLLSPLALLVAITANINLVICNGGPFFKITLVLQVAGYITAFIGLIVPSMQKIIVVKLAIAFLSLNWFVVLGFIEFLSNRKAHLWKLSPATNLD